MFYYFACRSFKLHLAVSIPFVKLLQDAGCKWQVASCCYIECHVIHSRMTGNSKR